MQNSSIHSSSSVGSSENNNNNGTSSVRALPSSAALQLLLSPDGYYKYLCIPKPPPKPFNTSILTSDNKQQQQQEQQDGIDVDLVKKNYRRLSLKHHPDRKTGDAETFRVLNRAQKVLTTPKLRKEYDLVGLDLDDDDDDHHHHDDDGNNATDDKHDDTTDKNTTGAADTVMSHIASATIAGILQAAVRTAMMAFVSTFLTRYKYIVYIIVLLLLGLAVRIFLMTNAQIKDGGKFAFVASCPTVMIAMGVYCMYTGRGVIDETSGEIIQWTYTFCFGEIMVMSMFIQNSIPTKSKPILILCTIFSTITCLILRGKFWRYASVLAFEIIIGLIAVLAFPIMEMILEEVVNEKLRKVGEKVRAHNERMEKVKQQQGVSGSASGGGVSKKYEAID